MKIKIGVWQSELTKNYQGIKDLIDIYPYTHNVYLDSIKNYMDGRDDEYETVVVVDETASKGRQLKSFVDVIILPYVMVIDEDMCKTLYDFTRVGGGILVLNGAIGARASIHDESLEPTKRFADMFGLKEDRTGDLFRYIGDWEGAKIDQIELMSDGCIIPKKFSGSIIIPKNNDGDVYMGVNNGTPLGTIVDNKQRRYPAFIKNEYGTGRVFIFNFNPCGDLEENYIVKSIMHNAILWLAKDDIKVKEPPAVQQVIYIENFTGEIGRDKQIAGGDIVAGSKTGDVGMLRGGVGSAEKVFSNCPHCGEALNLPNTPKFCPYCGGQLK